MQPTLAITGANGFIGRHLVAAARAAGSPVRGLVRSEAAARIVTEAGGEARRIESWDEAALAQAFRGAAAVAHLANVGAERGAATYEAVNVRGTQAVIEACRRAGVPRVAYLSGLGVARYGMAPRCSNRYFLSKLAAELALFRSGLAVAVLRPSYVVGAGGELIPQLVREMAEGEVEQIGDGSYRMQPIDVEDAAAAILAGLDTARPALAVLDLVGPQPMSYAAFVARVSRVAAGLGLGGSHRVREIPVVEAERQAAAGGYRGMLSDELDCLLCDEVADARPLEALLGRPLVPVDAAIERALRATLTSAR